MRADPVFPQQQVVADEAPVVAELRRRLHERLAEVRGLEKVLWLERPEDLEGKEALDAVEANLLLQDIPDVPVFLLRCLHALRPDGLLLMNVPGAESFREFRAAWEEVDGVHRPSLLPDVRDVGGVLERLRVALPVVDRDVMTLTFADFPTLYAQLRRHGVRGGGRSGLVTPRRLAAIEDVYRRMFGRPDGRLPLTLEVIYLHAFKPGPGQPQAARRGSGKVSLVRIVEGGGSDGD